MNTEVQLEKRQCKNCALIFKVMVSSKQKVCSTRCEESGLKCLDPKRVLKLEKSDPEKVSVSVIGPTQPIDRKSWLEARRSAWQTNPKRTSVKGNDMLQTERSSVPEENDGSLKTKKDSTPAPDRTIKETVRDFAPPSTQVKRDETRSMVSKKQSPTVVLVASHSMSLIDDTAEQLHGLMKNITEKKTNEPQTTEAVLAACNCAKQIYSLMRLKMDCIKMEIGSL